MLTALCFGNNNNNELISSDKYRAEDGVNFPHVFACALKANVHHLTDPIRPFSSLQFDPSFICIIFQTPGCCEQQSGSWNSFSATNSQSYTATDGCQHGGITANSDSHGSSADARLCRVLHGELRPMAKEPWRMGKWFHFCIDCDYVFYRRAFSGCYELYFFLCIINHTDFFICRRMQ